HFDPVCVDAFLRVIDKTVEEMARNGEGPLTLKAKPPTAKGSRAEQAALHIQRASSEIWALYEVAQTTSCSLGLQETLEILARKLQAIFPGSSCLFMLKDEETDLLKVRAAVGVNQEFLVGSRTVTSASCSEEVCRRGITYLGDYDQDDLMLNSVQATEWVPLRTCMIVPIKYQGEQLGTINVYHPSEVAFSVQDRLLLESIAERAGMAVYSGQLYERTRSDAVTDPLTGLYNLRYLTQYVEEKCTMEIRSFEREILKPRLIGEFPSEQVSYRNGIDRRIGRQKDCFALLCLDLDSFKPINDNFGHQKGDQVLQELSTLFRSVVREDDIVARYGGDEFIIVLQGAGPAEAQELANRLQAAVERYEPNLHHPRLGSLHLSVSIGYACYPLHGEDCTSLLSAADAHMYQHKAERKLGRLAERNKNNDGLREFEEDLQLIPMNLQRSFLIEQTVPSGRPTEKSDILR
ncbi:MAG: sensor domain-containing diguanylate cyclase, partial [Chthonomonadales bacterium]